MTPAEQILRSIEELSSVEKAATPGPWEFDHAINTSNGTRTRAIYHCPSECHTVEIIESPDQLGGECIHQSDADALLIAHARNTYPQLLLALRETVKAHEKNANEDYRGNRSAESRRSFLALQSAAQILGVKP